MVLYGMEQNRLDYKRKKKLKRKVTSFFLF